LCANILFAIEVGTREESIDSKPEKRMSLHLPSLGKKPSITKPSAEELGDQVQHINPNQSGSNLTPKSLEAIQEEEVEHPLRFITTKLIANRAIPHLS